MKVTQNEKALVVEGKNYKLTYRPARPHHVELVFDNGIGAELFVASGCDRDEGIDELRSLEAPKVAKNASKVTVTFAGVTTLWEKAQYTFTCQEDKVLYAYKVSGAGKLDSARFFEGFVENDPRQAKGFCPWFPWGYKDEVWHRPAKQFMTSSTPNFDLLETFSINCSDTRQTMYYQDVSMRVCGDRTYMAGDWLVTPPPFLYLMAKRGKSQYVSMGLVCKAGQNNFQEFQYAGGEGFGLNITYDGYTRIDGSWESPQILFQASSGDVYQGLQQYCDYLRAGKYVKAADRRKAPRWWYEPIFGGWGEQMFFSSNWDDYLRKPSTRAHVDSSEMCTRKAYEKMLATLEEKGVLPTILIIDNRWFDVHCAMVTDPKLWPDMKGFIREQHAKGRKVILWVSPWSYCISGNGKDVPITEHLVQDVDPYELQLDTDIFFPFLKRDKKKIRKKIVSDQVARDWRLTVDPQNRAYEKRLRAKIDYLLSPEGLDADGFEFDYTHFLPIYRDMKAADGRQNILWGVEMLHALMAIYADQAHKSKPDALLISHMFNPYFDDVTDMLRLQDIYTDRRSIVPQMDHRARVAMAVAPSCPIHTDQHPMPSLEAWREYAQYQLKIGNPCLYYVSGIETTGEKLEDQDFAMLRKTWTQHHAKLDRIYGPRKK